MSQKEKDKGSPIWLTIYSDLMTNLMLFFLMLYGITRLSVEVKATILDAIARQFQSPEKRKIVIESFKKTAQMMKTFSAQIAKNPAIESILEEPGYYKILLKAPVLFESNSASLSPSSKPLLRELAKFLREIPNKVEIAGHTDNVPVVRGKWKSNFELSLARAESVRKFLVAQGLDEKRFCIAGYGDKRPLLPNDSPVNRLKNRRIEVFILK